MNRILFESREIKNGIITLDDARAEHIRQVLHGEVGQVLKTGEVNGKIGTSEIVALTEATVTLRVNHAEDSLPPWADLILAPPRPRAFKRLLPQLAQLGVGRIFLVGAKKVEKDFWGATILKEANYRPLLLDGLMQAGTSILPTIEIRKAFGRFIDEELPQMSGRKIVAHPTPQAQSFAPEAKTRERLILAVGPEGGWTDEEFARLTAKGFAHYSLGARILRTDTAVVALLARFMEIQ